MRMHLDRKKDILDLPVVSATEAAVIFRCGQVTFKKRFAEVLHKEIRGAKNGKGYLYLLLDVLRSAYPDADRRTLHMMAVEYTLRFDQMRKANKIRKAREERGKDADTET